MLAGGRRTLPLSVTSGEARRCCYGFSAVSRAISHHIGVDRIPIGDEGPEAGEMAVQRLNEHDTDLNAPTAMPGSPRAMQTQAAQGRLPRHPDVACTHPSRTATGRGGSRRGPGHPRHASRTCMATPALTTDGARKLVWRLCKAGDISVDGEPRVPDASRHQAGRRWGRLALRRLRGRPVGPPARRYLDGGNVLTD